MKISPRIQALASALEPPRSGFGWWARSLTAAALLCINTHSLAQDPGEPEIPELRDPTGGPAQPPPNTAWTYPEDDRAAPIPAPPMKTGSDAWETGHYRAATMATEVDPGLLGHTDGVYGRFDGDLVYGLYVGGRLGTANAGALQGSLHDFSSIGLVGTLTHDLGADTAERFSLSVELDIRPLFLPRWALDLEHGPAWLDLLIDSVGIGIGGYWGSPLGGEFGDTKGVLGSLSLGLPLMAQAEGLWLRARGARRFNDAQNSVLFVLGWDFLDIAPWL